MTDLCDLPEHHQRVDQTGVPIYIEFSQQEDTFDVEHTRETIMNILKEHYTKAKNTQIITFAFLFLFICILNSPFF